jgi:hypothetical protein
MEEPSQIRTLNSTKKCSVFEIKSVKSESSRVDIELPSGDDHNLSSESDVELGDKGSIERQKIRKSSSSISYKRKKASH